MNNAQVHRFGSKVAVSLPGPGPTVYLTEKQARQISRAMLECAQDIKKKPRFVNTTFDTRHIDIK